MEQPHVIVLFGATGDLARRKLLPGLLRLFQAGLLEDCRIVGTSLEDLDTEQFVKLAREACDEFGTARSTRPLGRRSPRCSPTSRRATARTRWPTAVAEAEAELAESDGEVRRLHYLSVPPKAALAGRPAARRGRPGRALPDHHGEAVRHRPGVGEGAERAAARGLRRGADLPDRPLPRQGGGAEHPGLPVRQRPVRADLEPQLHRPRADRRAGDPRPGDAGRRSTSPPARSATWWSPT